MLKELKKYDIDNIMELWKSEVARSNKSLKSENIKDKYTNVRNQFINNLTSTIIYTEDGEIEGFVSINENNEIWSIAVKSNIRREGIGTILLEYCKKKYERLTTRIPKDNEIALEFFYKNEFKKIKDIEQADQESKYTLEWKSEKKKKISLIYFDDTINRSLIKKDSNINFKCINVKQFLESEGRKTIKTIEINDIRTYIKLRRELEDIINDEKVLLYIDYNNYYSYLDEMIKEIVKIKKIKLNVIICEPFSIEGSKKNNCIKEIEQIYIDYEIHKIDCSLDTNKDINLNQIFYKRNEILLQKIEEIAENM